MRSRQLLFLSVLCLGLLFAEALTTDDKINSIIAKHAAQWRTKISHHSEPEKVQHSITEHNCIHDTVVNPLIEKSKQKLRIFAEEKNLVPQQKEKQVHKRTDYENMEFYIYDQKISNGTKDPNRACYNTGSTVCLVGWDQNLNLQCTNYVCQSDDLLTDTLQTFFRVSVLPTLTEIFTEVIQAPASDSNLVLNADTWEGLGGVCYPSDVAIPQSFTTTGVPNADFAVFVTARPCDSPNTVAYAAACNYEVTDFNNFKIGRPLAGIINFCPRQFQQFLDGSYTDFEFQGAVKVAVHELTHALGFSSWMYDSFVDENGDYYSNPVNEFTRSGTSAAGDSFSEDIVELQTPNLVSFAKDHYGCSNIKGVELENYGGAGTAGSHWELRVAGDEYMCGFINPSMPVSGLTLSLFDDMGWYKTNKEKADYWAWGKDQGCGFLNERCEDSWPDADEGYWCDTDSAADKCTPDHKAKGQCRVGTYNSNLPAYYQHFTNRRLGGSNVAADCCPFTQASFDGSNYCIDTSHTGSSSFFEEYSSTSACFHVVQGTTETPICYSYECASTTQLTITIDGETFDCPTDGGQVSVDGVLSGAKVECPPASLLCREAVGTSSERLSGSMLIIFVGVMFAVIF